MGTCLDTKSSKCVTGVEVENSAVILLLCGSMKEAFTTASEDDDGGDTTGSTPYRFNTESNRIIIDMLLVHYTTIHVDLTCWSEGSSDCEIPNPTNSENTQE